MAHRQSAHFRPIASVSGTEEDTSTNGEVELRRVAELPDSRIAKRDGDEDDQVEEVLSIKRERVQAQGYFSKTGGFVELVKEKVELELRVSKDGTHLELGVLQQREVLQLVFVLPEEDENEKAVTKKNCCTGACFCDLSGCDCRNLPVLETQALLEMKNKGSTLIREHLFPLFSTYGRVIVALLELLTAVVMYAVALPTLVKEANEGSPPVTDLVRLPISIVSIILAGIDTFFATRALHQRRNESGNTPEPGGEQELSDAQYRLIEDDSSTKANKLSVVERFDKYYSDLVRVVIAEILIYPTVICNMFDHATKRTYEGNHGALENFAFARFILSAIWLIVHVYLFRLIVIGGTIVLLEKARRGKSEKKATQDGNSDKIKLWEDSTTKRRALRGIVLEVFFLIHIFGQMFTQSLMLGAIWSKFQCENPEGLESMNVSPFTWTMIGLGFILPIAGTFTFFIPTYFWAQEFPIDFMVTMLTALQKRGIIKFKKGAQDTKDKLDSVLMRIETATRKHKANFFRKLFHPLLSPILVILSCVYDVALFSFIVLSFVGSAGNEYFLCPFGPDVTNSSDPTTGPNVTNSSDPTTGPDVTNTSTPTTVMDLVGGYNFEVTPTVRFWLLYAAVAVGLGNIANIIVVLIGLFWMSIGAFLAPALPFAFFVPLILWHVPLFVACCGNVTGRF